MITLEGVSYSYPGSSHPVLNRVDLEVHDGEFILIAGGSGTGKSTLLRSMNGLVPHFHGGTFSGRVDVDGRDTARARPRDLADRVGFVGQDPEHHGVTDRVEDDIAFTLENLGIDPSTMRKRVEEVMDALGIAALRTRRLDSLSGGERQRAAIASALVAMPTHLLLDEPTSQLDPQSAEEVIGSLLRLRDEIGVSVALVEHRLERIIQYADRLCVMNEGIDAGDPADVLTRHEIGPPIVKLGRALQWHPLPLTLRAARSRIQSQSVHAPEPGTPIANGETATNVSQLDIALGGVTVLKRIDLDVATGEVVVLMGRNGSGKTTLLRTLAGLVPPSRGRVSLPERIALVPQNPELLLYRKSVAEEIAATLRGRGRDAGSSAIDSEAQRFGVSELLTRYPRELSAGEKTRVAIAAAAAGDPSMILLDEPTRGMDEAGKQHLIDLLHQWQRSDAAVILATHDVELAARAASRVVLLADGEVVLDGNPRSALAASLTFSTQMNKIFGDPGILTLDDALSALGRTPETHEARREASP